VGSRSASCTAQAKASSLSKLGRCRLFFLLFVAPRAQMVVYWCARVSRGESEQSSSSSVLVVRVRRSWRKELPPREGVIDGSRGGVVCGRGSLSRRCCCGSNCGGVTERASLCSPRSGPRSLANARARGRCAVVVVASSGPTHSAARRRGDGYSRRWITAWMTREKWVCRALVVPRCLVSYAPRRLV
jgi:hypothetical protein